jgi:hypothetical protein
LPSPHEKALLLSISVAVESWIEKVIPRCSPPFRLEINVVIFGAVALANGL